MAWNVEHTDEFAAWWDELSEAQQEDITATVLLLMDHGPQLPFPHSSGIEGSRHRSAPDGDPADRRRQDWRQALFREDDPCRGSPL